MTPQYLTLPQVKAHCNLDSSDTSEDQLLTLYMSAAEQSILNRINSSYTRIEDDYGTDVPEPILAAMYILVATYYKYRELSTQDAMNKVPGIFWESLAPYVNLD